MSFLRTFSSRKLPTYGISAMLLQENMIDITDNDLQIINNGAKPGMKAAYVKEVCSKISGVIVILCSVPQLRDFKALASLTTLICISACLMAKVSTELQEGDNNYLAINVALRQLSRQLLSACGLTMKSSSQFLPFHIIRLNGIIKRVEQEHMQLSEAVEIFAASWNIPLEVKSATDVVQVRSKILKKMRTFRTRGGLVAAEHHGNEEESDLAPEAFCVPSGIAAPSLQSSTNTPPMASSPSPAPVSDDSIETAADPSSDAPGVNLLPPLSLTPSTTSSASTSFPPTPPNLLRNATLYPTLSPGPSISSGSGDITFTFISGNHTVHDSSNVESYINSNNTKAVNMTFV